MPSCREFARNLGLTYHNETKGRLSFEKNSATSTLWRGLLNASGGERHERQPFQYVVDLLDRFGPQIWGSGDRSHLLQAGQHPEYPVDLFWSHHSQEIRSICKRLYDFRNEQDLQTRRASNKRKFDDTPSLDPYSALQPRIYHSQKRVRPCASEGDSPNDLFLTHLWIMSPDRRLSTVVSVGKHRTIDALFTAIRDRFMDDNATTEVKAKGSIRKLIIAIPMNLQPLKPILELTSVDDDKVLLKFRSEIFQAYLSEREDIDGEEIICFTTAYFDADLATYKATTIV